MNTVKLSNTHLQVISKALEVYSRLKAGQISIALDEAFDFKLTYEERDICEKFVRQITHKELPSNSYYGVACKEIGNGQIAYEVLKVFRQYLAVSRNNGYFKHTVDYQEPLKVSTEPLPIIEGFKTYKDIEVHPRAGKKILDYLGKGKYKEMWDYIGTIKGIPEGDKKEIVHWMGKTSIRVWKPTLPNDNL